MRSPANQGARKRACPLHSSHKAPPCILVGHASVTLMASNPGKRRCRMPCEHVLTLKAQAQATQTLATAARSSLPLQCVPHRPMCHMHCGGHASPNQPKTHLAHTLFTHTQALTTAAQCSATAVLPLLLSIISLTPSTHACQPCRPPTQQQTEHTPGDLIRMAVTLTAGCIGACCHSHSGLNGCLLSLALSVSPAPRTPSCTALLS